MKSNCADMFRPLFEEAALAHHEDDPGVAGSKLGEALSLLYECLDTPAAVERALEEVERWFSFFDWWYSSRLLNNGKPSKAWEILIDLTESFGPQRSVELGIEADYGAMQVSELYDKTMSALELIQSGELIEASRCALEAADIQYRLAVERAGTPQPGG